jgi:hypothetical protein
MARTNHAAVIYETRGSAKTHITKTPDPIKGRDCICKKLRLTS